LLKECFWSFDLMCEIFWERLQCENVPSSAVRELFTRDSTVVQYCSMFGTAVHLTVRSNPVIGILSLEASLRLQGVIKGLSQSGI
jgi:hypothetical protein